jgi:hypothetical protein
MIRGQWLGLRRRFLVPLLLTEACSLALAFAGYFTLGFGGMLDPDDRALWLGVWLGGILILPCTLRALCWVAMRRALFARNLAEATGVAFLQVIALPAFSIWAIYLLALWRRAELSVLVVGLLFAVAFVGAPVLFARRARRIVLAELRHSASERF